MREANPSELLERLALDEDGLADETLVVVDCADPSDPGIARELESRLAGMPIVTIAVGGDATHPLRDALDTFVDDAARLERITATVTAHPQASVAMAVLLRGGQYRSVAEGLVAESVTYATLQAGDDHRRWLRGRTTRAPVADDGEPAVRVARSGDELHLTLDRPAVRNAFNARMRDDLIAALSVAAADPSVRVVIDASGSSFCAGGDLSEFGTTPDPATAHLVRLRRSAGRALHRVADRVRVVVHGACVGAGVELPAFAREVVATPDARFWLPELAMGLVPGAGGTVSLPRRIGRQRTLLMALLDEPIDAETARAWGLVDRIEPA